MSESLNLVFKYFFAVGAGVGAGLLLTVGISVAAYKELSKKLHRKWYDKGVQHKWK